MLKKMKNSLLGLSLILLVGCTPKNKSLLDFEKYKNLDVKNIYQIDVDWDIDDNKPIEFSIIDKNEIDTILDLYCKDDAFVYSGKGLDDGGHSSLTLLHKSNGETKVSLHRISEGSNYYIYSDKTIYNTIHDIGVRLGYLE